MADPKKKKSARNPKTKNEQMSRADAYEHIGKRATRIGNTISTLSDAGNSVATVASMTGNASMSAPMSVVSSAAGMLSSRYYNKGSRYQGKASELRSKHYTTQDSNYQGDDKYDMNKDTVNVKVKRAKTGQVKRVKLTDKKDKLIRKTGGSVPQRRNSLAGKYTGTSESSKFFASHPKSRAKKNEYNKKYHSTTSRKKYRAELNSYNAKHGGSGDASHTKSGNIVREASSTNRARNGKNGKSSKK